jgi:hypothetical protein
MNKEKFDHIIERIRAVLMSDISFYPQSVSGFGDERDYEKRDDFMNGHNHAMDRISTAISDILEEETGEYRENFKCHLCNGKRYLTEEEYAKSQED